MAELRGWLLQVLLAPRKSESKIDKLSEVMAFGGGGSGLSKEAQEIVYQLWSFDYMGAAEYEFGALPKALNAIVKDQKDLVAWVHHMPKESIRGDEWKRKGPRGGEKHPLIKDVDCYCIARKQHMSEVVRILGEIAGGKHRTKAGHRGEAFFDPIEEWDRKVRGWVDVTEGGGFFVFNDKEMWKRTAETFGAEMVTKDA